MIVIVIVIMKELRGFVIVIMIFFESNDYDHLFWGFCQVSLFSVWVIVILDCNHS